MSVTAVTVPALPSSLFTLTATDHVDCPPCQAHAPRAVTMARVTGSRQAMHADTVHGAVVTRVRRPATEREEDDDADPTCACGAPMSAWKCTAGH